MPGARQHSTKWDRCVRDLQRRGTAVSPYAVCTAALEESVQRTPHHNPLRSRTLYAVLKARKGRSVLYLNKKDKFTRQAGRAKTFPNAQAALRRAQSVLRRYPHLQQYRFSIGWVY